MLITIIRFASVLLLMLIEQRSAFHVHRPKLHDCDAWSSKGEDVAKLSKHASNPMGWLIDEQNEIHVTFRKRNHRFIWSTKRKSLIRIKPRQFLYHRIIDELADFMLDGQIKHRDHCSDTVNTLLLAMHGPCWGFFVDRHGRWYCSLRNEHRVIRYSFVPYTGRGEYLLGDRRDGNSAKTLHHPTAIYVDDHFNLYVADTDNCRVQLLEDGQSEAKTFVGHGSIIDFGLDRPTGLSMDENRRLYILQHHEHCIFRCSKTKCDCIIKQSHSDHPHGPSHLAFDSHGNLLVLNEGNGRIQRFNLQENSRYSYHRPHLCGSARWNPSATEVNLKSTGISQPRALFINNHNRIHLADRWNGKLAIWDRDNIQSARTLDFHVSEHSDLFVDLNGDVYFEKQHEKGRIEKVSKHQDQSIVVAKFTEDCYGLFIDLNNDLYCSQAWKHQVTKMSLDRENQSEIIVAGGFPYGPFPHQLHLPWGIFVDQHFNLFVADVDNHRIQRFRAGHREGETVAGNGIPSGLTLNRPTDVISDANCHLYIIDNQQGRVVRSDGTLLQCIIGCDEPYVSRRFTPPQPYAIHFDSEGHLYVTDGTEPFIRKFELVSNGCPQTKTGSSADDPLADSPMDSPEATSASKCASGESPWPLVVPCPYNRDEAHCVIADDLCARDSPCQNGGNCTDDLTATFEYTCSCPEFFKGMDCEIDDQPCEPNPCWHNGECSGTSKSNFNCSCQSDWQGDQCESKLDYCHNITRKNGGRCRSLVGNFICDCPTEDYSGELCETLSMKIEAFQFVSKSFGFVAILSMVAVAVLVIVMDVLKYFFDIDPVGKERERLEKEKRRRLIAVRFLYVPHGARKEMFV